jgi:hypothetical protein
MRIEKPAASLVALLAAAIATGQDLVPRAYLITPAGSSAVTLSSSWNGGQIAFEPSVPVEDASGSFESYVLSYYHSYSLAGRSSNLVVSLPYATGNFEGVVAGRHGQLYRSGVADARIRLAVNLRGGPAMKVEEFREWHEKSLIGASVTAVIPIGQNDTARAINIGSRRWALKPGGVRGRLAIHAKPQLLPRR